MLFLQLAQVRVVIFLDISIGNQDSRPKALIDEVEYRHLPEQMIVQLVFGEAVAFKRRAETRVGLRRTGIFGPDRAWPWPACRWRGRNLRVRFHRGSRPDRSDDRQPVCEPRPRIERLIVQELGEPQFVFDVTDLDRVLSDDNGDAVENDGARKAGSEEDQ